MNNTIGQLVYIEWLDSAAMHGWQALGEVREHATLVVIQSVGWVIHETDDAITLVAHIHKDVPENGDVRLATDPLTIPKGVIRERRVMRKR
jgi:hypothetical protein